MVHLVVLMIGIVFCPVTSIIDDIDSATVIRNPLKTRGVDFRASLWRGFKYRQRYLFITTIYAFSDSMLILRDISIASDTRSIFASSFEDNYILSVCLIILAVFITMSVTVKHNSITSRRNVSRLQRCRVRAIVTYAKLIVVAINVTTMLTYHNPSKRLPIVQFYLYFSCLLLTSFIKVSFRLGAVNFFVLRRYTTVRNSTPVAFVAYITIRSTSHNLAHRLTACLVALLPVVHRSSSTIVG